MDANKDKILSRNEIEEKYTWDISHIYKNVDEYKKAVEELVSSAEKFTDTYRGKIKGKEILLKSLPEYEKIEELYSKTEGYVHLLISTDRTDAENLKLLSGFYSETGTPMGNLAFYTEEISRLNGDVIKAASEENEDYRVFLDKILKRKQHMLSGETERILSTLSETMELPYTIYETAKLADMEFPDFEADGKTYPLSFAKFEGEYEYEENTEIRREAFRAFSEELEKYKNTIGAAYYGQVRKEKTIADLRGYRSVFEYLLEPQDVAEELYDRQLDVIMEELAPYMRKYAGLIKKVHGLDKMTYADLKLDLDPQFEPEVTPEEAEEDVIGALSILGEEYTSIVKEALSGRWIDYMQNKGKSTGGFCSAPAGIHPYILLNWTGRMREVFVLAHELGHAGQDILTEKKKNFLSRGLSMYSVEAPSTMNEMLMGNYLMNKDEDLRFRRWVAASMIARTYFHNFVTHFLEGYYQREVYRAIDKGEPLSADDFSRIFRETLEKFWGSEVEITDGAELTWMRQPHYYMGLYPYTYSAGLTIATAVSRKILTEGENAVKPWLKVLEAGGTLTPVEFAKEAGVDITGEGPLRETIDYIGQLVDTLYELTAELKEVHENKNGEDLIPDAEHKMKKLYSLRKKETGQGKETSKDDKDGRNDKESIKKKGKNQ